MMEEHGMMLLAHKEALARMQEEHAATVGEAEAALSEAHEASLKGLLNDYCASRIQSHFRQWRGRQALRTQHRAHLEGIDGTVAAVSAGRVRAEQQRNQRRKPV